MPELRAGNPAQLEFRAELLAAGLLIETSVPGVYARGAEFERIRLGFDALVTRTAAEQLPEPMLFPPVIPREQLETSGYLGTFPHLAGSVFGFEGNEADAAGQHELASRHEDWSAFQTMSDLVLTPAACYPLYPAIAARGPVPAGGLVLDTGDAYVFRREPSTDPARMQIFHMREIVRVGERATVLEWREAWRSRATELLRDLELDINTDLANDPFFGRSGRLLASAQREQELKWELLAPVAENPTAIASSNFHEDHFGHTFALTMEDGSPACTGCTAFGEERITLALLSAHGLDTAAWPESVRAQLGL